MKLVDTGGLRGQEVGPGLGAAVLRYVQCGSLRGRIHAGWCFVFLSLLVELSPVWIRGSISELLTGSGIIDRVGLINQLGTIILAIDMVLRVLPYSRHFD